MVLLLRPSAVASPRIPSRGGRRLGRWASLGWECELLVRACPRDRYPRAGRGQPRLTVTGTSANICFRSPRGPVPDPLRRTPPSDSARARNRQEEYRICLPRRHGVVGRTPSWSFLSCRPQDRPARGRGRGSRARRARSHALRGGRPPRIEGIWADPSFGGGPRPAHLPRRAFVQAWDPHPPRRRSAGMRGGPVPLPRESGRIKAVCPCREGSVRRSSLGREAG